MTQELVNVNRATGEIVAAVGGLPRWEIDGSMPLDINDLRPPLLRAVQAVSRNLPPEARLGEWLLSGDTKSRPEIRVVFVGLMNKSRAHFQKDVFDRPPICASDDNVLPRSAEEATAIGAGPTCRDCRFSAFGPNGEAPPCGEAWNFLGVPDDDEQMPFLYRATGTAIAEARRFVAPFYYKHRPLFRAKTTLRTQRKEDDRGVYYVPVFDPTLLDGAEAERWTEIAQPYIGFRAQADYPEHGGVQEVAAPATKHEEIPAAELLKNGPPPASRRAGPATNPADDLYAAESRPLTQQEQEAALFDEIEAEKDEAFEAFRAKLNAPSTPRRGR